MSHLTNWQLHGTVRTLRTEHAEWDLAREEWQPPRFYGVIHFHPDGKTRETESHNPDGSVAHSNYAYDDAGRLTEIEYRTDAGPVSRVLYDYDSASRHIQTLEIAADGTTRESQISTYDSAGHQTKVVFLPPQKPGETVGYDISDSQLDENDRPAEVILQDALHRVVGRVRFARDSQGKLLTQTHLAGENAMQDVEKSLENVSPEDRKQAMATLKNIFGPGQTISTTTYTYDQTGRLVERIRLGELGGSRATYIYDDDGQKIEETMEHHSVSRSSHAQCFRFEYRYDAQRNWTERLVWSRVAPNPEFQRSNIERREISYYGV